MLRQNSTPAQVLGNTMQHVYMVMEYVEHELAPQEPPPAPPALETSGHLLHSY
jgi:hypothetical protein